MRSSHAGASQSVTPRMHASHHHHNTLVTPYAPHHSLPASHASSHASPSLDGTGRRVLRAAAHEGRQIHPAASDLPALTVGTSRRLTTTRRRSGLHPLPHATWQSNRSAPTRRGHTGGGVPAGREGRGSCDRGRRPLIVRPLAESGSAGVSRGRASSVADGRPRSLGQRVHLNLLVSSTTQSCAP